MKVTDIYLGQILYTFDYAKNVFISLEVESITKVNNDIMVNGRFGIEDVFERLEEAYTHTCDLITEKYKVTINEITIKYSGYIKYMEEKKCKMN